MTNYMTNDTDLTSVANAIRSMTGKTSDLEFPTDYVNDIKNIGWKRPSDWPDLDSITVPSSFVGLYLTIINYDSTASYTLTIYGSDAATVQLGHIADGEYVVDETVPVSGTEYSRSATFTFTGIKVLKMTSSQQTSEVGLNSIPVYEAYTYSSVSIASCGYTKHIKHRNFKKTGMEYSHYQVCGSLQSLEFESVAANFTTVANMFIGCSMLESVTGISDSISPSVTTTYEMFYDCQRLTTIDISGLDMSNVTQTSAMFSGCNSLSELYPPTNIPISISFSPCPLLTKASLLRILNNLATVSESQTLTLHAYSKRLLTDDDIAIATNKGWTIA